MTVWPLSAQSRSSECWEKTRAASAAGRIGRRLALRQQSDWCARMYCPCLSLPFSCPFRIVLMLEWGAGREGESW